MLWFIFDRCPFQGGESSQCVSLGFVQGEEGKTAFIIALYFFQIHLSWAENIVLSLIFSKTFLHVEILI